MTAPTPVLLDTDTLSAILRRDPVVIAKARDHLRIHHHFTFSIITRYEFLRGLKAKHATKQQAAFDRFCAANTVLPLSDAIVVRAAKIYADLYQRGELIGDADILASWRGRRKRLRPYASIIASSSANYCVPFDFN